MVQVDASALLANFEYFKCEPFIIAMEEMERLSCMAEKGIRAASGILKWVYLHPEYVTFGETITDGVDYFTADYLWATKLRRYDKCHVYVVTNDEIQPYTGWAQIGGDTAAQAYSSVGNPLNLCEGQYIIVDDGEKAIDALKYDGSSYKKVKRREFRSDQLGSVQPKDPYQYCAFDSLLSNDMTVLYGPSGSGKTFIPLAYAMQELEAGRITRCHFIFHYEKLKYARELGYVKGTLQDKLLQTGSIGNILSSKLGDPAEVEHLINRGIINIMPTNAIRGFEAGDTEMIFCTEAQDLDAYTVRTIIQRAKKGCKIILEGDADEQVDISRKSGLGQVIEVFRGAPGFGCVKLVNDYRSPFGRLADKIR